MLHLRRPFSHPAAWRRQACDRPRDL